MNAAWRKQQRLKSRRHRHPRPKPPPLPPLRREAVRAWLWPTEPCDTGRIDPAVFVRQLQAGHVTDVPAGRYL